MHSITLTHCLLNSQSLFSIHQVKMSGLFTLNILYSQFEQTSTFNHIQRIMMNRSELLVLCMWHVKRRFMCFWCFLVLSTFFVSQTMQLVMFFIKNTNILSLVNVIKLTLQFYKFTNGLFSPSRFKMIYQFLFLKKYVKTYGK